MKKIDKLKNDINDLKKFNKVLLDHQLLQEKELEYYRMAFKSGKLKKGRIDINEK